MKPLLMAAGILASVAGMSGQDISPQDIAAAIDQARGPLSAPDADMAASFDLAAFMTDAGERTCKINDKDRAAMR